MPVVNGRNGTPVSIDVLRKMIRTPLCLSAVVLLMGSYQAWDASASRVGDMNQFKQAADRHRGKRSRRNEAYGGPAV